MDRFWVLGASGGGPYALACAHAIPGRITRAGVIRGVGPYSAPGAFDVLEWHRKQGHKLVLLTSSSPYESKVACEHFRLDDRIGALAPGRMADIVVIPSPGEFSPQIVLCEGKMIYRDGRILAPPRRAPFPDNLLDTIKVQPFTLTR